MSSRVLDTTISPLVIFGGFGRAFSSFCSRTQLDARRVASSACSDVSKKLIELMTPLSASMRYTIYVTATDVRHGLRFYENGLLVRRHVTAPGGVSGFNSLSPTGEGPRVELVGHLNWWSTFSVPGDEDTESTTSHGLDTRLKSPDGGILAIIAGRTDPEEVHTGVARFVEDPPIAEAICAASRPDDHAAARRRSPADTRRAPASGMRTGRAERAALGSTAALG